MYVQEWILNTIYVCIGMTVFFIAAGIIGGRIMRAWLRKRQREGWL